MKDVLIIGAGPAGLTAAYELAKIRGGYNIIVLEESNEIGGISKTVTYKNNRMDMGGHRFFSKDKRVNEWWKSMLPMQGSQAKDDLLLNRECKINPGGPNPEQIDNVMLNRHRVSRILFDNKFYDYPISLKLTTFTNMGLISTFLVGISYVLSLVHKLPEDNLENFYINRFGRRLYEMFFEYYTENLWGRHPKEIDASWGKQRVKGISILKIISDIFSKLIRKKNRKVETSLIEAFIYPKLGPGQLWEICAQKLEQLGVRMIKNAKVTKIHRNQSGRVEGLTYVINGEEKYLVGECIISSMPLKDLVLGMNGVPEMEKNIAKGLKYRDYMTLGVLVNKLKIKNSTDIRTIGNLVPDCWIYIQSREVKMGRLQIYNNWSPYMVNDIENTVWIGLEYFVQENDSFWNMSEKEFADMAVEEMIKLGLIDKKEEVLDYHLERVKKAYPAYFDTYKDIGKLRDYLDTIPNLYCIGRNGQHRYNNMDHSMCTAFEAVNNIERGIVSKENIWNVNTEEEYHEETLKSCGEKGETLINSTS